MGPPHRGDVLDRESLVEGAEGADVVVHAATAIPTGLRPSEEEWERNDRVRREGAQHLVATAAAVGADRLVLQSVAWLARRPDGGHFDEDAPRNPDRSTRSALEAERIVAGGADSHGFEPVVLRGGWFYAHDTAHTRQLGAGLLAGRLPIIGRGLLGRRDATLSFLHVDDAADAFAAAVEGEATGTFHVVDDAPATYADFLAGLADRLGAARPRRVPAWLAGLLVDDNLVRLLTRPMPTSNERFGGAFEWAPTYPSIEEGLDRVVDRWAAEGTIEPAGEGYRWTEP